MWASWDPSVEDGLPAVGSVGLVRLPRLSDVLMNYLLMRGRLQDAAGSTHCDRRHWGPGVALGQHTQSTSPTEVRPETL